MAAGLEVYDMRCFQLLGVVNAVTKIVTGCLNKELSDDKHRTLYTNDYSIDCNSLKVSTNTPFYGSRSEC